MSGKLARARIGGADVASIKAPTAVAGARAISGARIYDVGQGDAVAILNETGRTILQLDCGGRQDNPFEGKSRAEVDRMLPVSTDALVMITHWDEDHWSTGPKGDAAKDVDWLVPRQVTSPRAVRFAADLEKVRCIPETHVGTLFEYRAQNGDAILWQKIAKSSPSPAIHENCNRTGVAVALLRQSGGAGQVILLPGDAPFDEVPLFDALRSAGTTLTGLVAYHHGSKYPLRNGTRSLLRDWPVTPGGPCDIVFSYGTTNSYGHPHPDRYDMLTNRREVATPVLRTTKAPYHDILFR
jgi:beta-lactamase superfamily II metal-dependent hydrolase